MKKIIFLLAILISNIAYSQVCPTQQTRSDSVIACKLKVKNLASGLMKASSIGNVSIATAGTDYTTPTGSEALTNKTYNGITLTGSSTPTLAVTGTTTVSGTNTGDQTNISGNAATVTTNANLTGPITSVGNATSVASQTGTGSTFVMNTSPTLVTPLLGTPTSGVLTNTTGYLVNNIATSNISAASWTTSGVKLKLPPIRLTNTTSSGTVANIYNNLIGGDTLVASSSTTYTDAYGTYFIPPVSGTNVTQTNSWGIGVAGNIKMIGNTNITSTGNNRLACASGSTLSLNVVGDGNLWISSTSMTQTFGQKSLSTGTTPFMTFTQSAHTGGAQPGLLWTAGAHTSQTSGTEISDLNFNLARTVTWSTTAPTTQRFTRFQAPTMSCASVTTTTTAATVSISGAPVAAGSVTITNPYALLIEAGNSRFTGDIIADKLRIGALNTAPANASDTGTLGEIRIDDSYIYICTATNTWKRVAIATW